MEQIHHQYIKQFIDLIVPAGLKEWVLFIVDSIGVTMWAMIGNGQLHTLNLYLETAIKIVTLLGLIVALIIKLRKLFKHG